MKKKIKHKAIYIGDEWVEIERCRSCDFYYDSGYDECSLLRSYLPYGYDPEKEICIDCILPDYDLVREHYEDKQPEESGYYMIETRNDERFPAKFDRDSGWRHEGVIIKHEDVISWRYII